MGYGYVSIEIDVDVDDFLDGMTSREKQKLVDNLYDDGYYQSKLQDQLDGDVGTLSINEEFFREALAKFKDNYINLTNSEIEILMNISKRF